MSEIICPVCNYPTVPNGIEYIEDNIICPACYRHGSKKLWNSFISTKKKLDVCIRRLDQMTWGCNSADAEDLLKQIKDNDKDVK